MGGWGGSLWVGCGSSRTDGVCERERVGGGGEKCVCVRERESECACVFTRGDVCVRLIGRKRDGLNDAAGDSRVCVREHTRDGVSVCEREFEDGSAERLTREQRRE